MNNAQDKKRENKKHISIKQINQETKEQQYIKNIELLKNEAEKLRHELAIQTHNTHLAKNKTEKNLTKVEKALIDINNHFQQEIKLKKEMIEDEKKIDNLNYLIKAKEFELKKLIEKIASNMERGQMKTKSIQTTIYQMIEQVKNIKSKLDLKYINLGKLNTQRQEIENLIKKFSNDPMGSSLNVVYYYFVAYIDNLNNENQKAIQFNNLKSKELQINTMIDQMRLRDDIIKNVQTELKKRKITFSINPHIKSISELNIVHSPQIQKFHQKTVSIDKTNNQLKVDPVGVLKKTISERQQPPKLNESNVNNASILTNSNDFGKTNGINYSGYNHPNIIKEKKKFKTKTTEIIEKLKKNELTEIKLHMINDMFPNSKLVYLNSQNPQRRISNDKIGNMIALNDRLNNSMVSNKSTDLSNKSIKLDRSLDKKLKTILKTNITGRYKRSPYIK